jgi:prepilin-type N-terminal cleavage/methylation domain-containing protein
VVTPARHRAGFTLVELMVALAIGALMMMLCVPFGVAWMDGTRQLQARGDLIDAVGRAKSAALRNGDGRTSGQIVSRIVLEEDADGNEVLSVRNEQDGSVLWSAGLPRAVSLETLAGDAFVCAAYDSRAMAIEDEDEECTLSARLVVRISSREPLDVELL